MRKLSMALLAGVALVGCGVDSEVENQEITSNLIEAGYAADDIQVVDGMVYVGNDAHVTLEASREMLQRPEGSAEQYMTSNLVGTSVTKICINPSSAFNSYSRLSQGLDLAIQNYNQLGLRFTMVRGSSGCSATINAVPSSGAGGSAGFPSGGKPYGTINIGTGLQSYSVDVNEHVITHEIGHALGFRHTDYYNRSISCGGAASNEGTAGVGANLIPGTSGTAVVGGSIMNACFRSTETGEWTSSDITAINYMY